MGYNVRSADLPRARCFRRSFPRAFPMILALYFCLGGLEFSTFGNFALRSCFNVSLGPARAFADAPAAPVERFLAAIEGDESIGVEVRDLLGSTWRQCEECDGAEFLTQGLAVLSQPFRQILDAYDADNYQHCADLAGRIRTNVETSKHRNVETSRDHNVETPGFPLQTSDVSTFIQANSAAYEIKALVALEKNVEAQRHLESLLSDGGAAVTTYSYFAAEMAFLRGYCLLADVQYASAADALGVFLETYPQASLRLTIAAEQMLTELANREPERIGDVVDLMNYSRARLTHRDSGEIVQGRQERIVELLDRLIDEAEQDERNSCSGGGAGDGSRSSRGRDPQTPMQESRLPGGSPQQGPLGPARRANPAEVWGTMPPSERDRILQALRESFPSRYRQLVEQYYEELAKKP